MTPMQTPEQALARTVVRLCATSQKRFINPFERLQWPDALAPGTHWYMAPELCSLSGTTEWSALDEQQRKTLSFWEAVNFHSINIHGERSLLEGLAQRLHRHETASVSPYLHHFLDEENKHMAYFSRFCTRYGGKIYPDRKLPLPREHAPGEETLLFFLKALVFEEIVDVYNRTMAKDGRLHPLVREINWLHHFEEARHLAFGRTFVADAWRRLRAGQPQAVAGVRATVRAYVEATWREYYNPDVYRDAGLPDAFALRRRALAHPEQVAHRARVSKGLLAYLAKHDIVGGPSDPLAVSIG